MALSQDFAGTAVTIRDLGGGHAELEVGCRCRLALALDGSRLASADPGHGQTCELIAQTRDITAAVTSVTVDTTDGERATLTLAGAAGVSGMPCESFAIREVHATRRAPLPDCGADDTAVAVVPYDRAGAADCTIGAGREGFEIDMSDENAPQCSATTGTTHDTGARGEGAGGGPAGGEGAPG